MNKEELIERIKKLEKENETLIDDFLEGIPKKKKYTIRMDITFNRKLTQEEAEKVIHNALHSAGVVGRMGGIS